MLLLWKKREMLHVSLSTLTRPLTFPRSESGQRPKNLSGIGFSHWDLSSLFCIKARWSIGLLAQHTLPSPFEPVRWQSIRISQHRPRTKHPNGHQPSDRQGDAGSTS